MKHRFIVRCLKEATDIDYDRETRKRYHKIAIKVHNIPPRMFSKVIKQDYEYYLGVCEKNNIINKLSEIEFDIVRAIIENIEEGYYE